jgi:hypothetical protein
MIDTTQHDPASKEYFHEAMADDDKLRIICWPRHAGKSLLIHKEIDRLDVEGNTILVVHPNNDECKEFDTATQNTFDRVYSCSYEDIVDVAEDIVEIIGLTQLYVYFSEPDEYDVEEWGDPYIILADALTEMMEKSVVISQVTYIGTPSHIHPCSILRRLAGLVQHSHPVHPCEIFPDWEDKERFFAKMQTPKAIRHILFGEV